MILISSAVVAYEGDRSKGNAPLFYGQGIGS